MTHRLCVLEVGGVFQYFIKVVPTIYSDISSKVHSYQFSYTQQARYLDPYGQLSALPGTSCVALTREPLVRRFDNPRVSFLYLQARSSCSTSRRSS